MLKVAKINHLKGKSWDDSKNVGCQEHKVPEYTRAVLFCESNLFFVYPGQLAGSSTLEESKVCRLALWKEAANNLSCYLMP